MEKLLSVSINWHRGEQTQSELWWRTLRSLAFHKPPHPYIKGLEMVWIFSKTQCLIFFFPQLHSTNELAAPPEVDNNVLTSDFIFLWPEQSVWHTIWGSGYCSELYSVFCRYFSLGCWQGSRLLRLTPLTLSLVFPIFFAWKLNLSQAAFPLAINSHRLADWIGSHAASLWRLIGLLEMQETLTW